MDPSESDVWADPAQEATYCATTDSSVQRHDDDRCDVTPRASHPQNPIPPPLTQPPRRFDSLGGAAYFIFTGGRPGIN